MQTLPLTSAWPPLAPSPPWSPSASSCPPPGRSPGQSPRDAEMYHMRLSGYIDIRAADLRLDVLRAVQGEAVTLEVGEGHVGHVWASQHVSRLHRAVTAGQTLSPGTQRSCQT